MVFIWGDKVKCEYVIYHTLPYAFDKDNGNELVKHQNVLAIYKIKHFILSEFCLIFTDKTNIFLIILLNIPNRF